MNRLLVCFAVLLTLSCSAAQLPAARQIFLETSDRMLRNPGSGLCFMPGLEPASHFPKWVLDVCSTAYFRLDWQDVMDDKGNYIFEKLETRVFSTYRKLGLRIAFRIMAADIHSSRANPFPKFLIERDRIPVVDLTGVYGQKQQEPVFWNPDYIREHANLMRALGAYIDAHPDIEFVDFGGMGEWGEMHLGKWTAADLERTGYSPEKYLNAVLAMMEQMERCLPRTRKAFCVAPLRKEMEPVFALIVDGAVRHGWWLRSDGCSDQGPPGYTQDIFRKFVPRTGLIFEPSGGINRGYSGEPVQVRRYFDALLPYLPSYLNLMGMWDLSKLTGDEIKVCEQVSRRVGYRFSYVRCGLPDRISLAADRPTFLPVRVTLSNSGLSFYYGSALYKIRILQAGRTVADSVFFPLGKQVAEIGPAVTSTETFMVELPAGLPPGNLDIRLGLEDTVSGLLGLANIATGSDGFVHAGVIPALGGGQAVAAFDLSRETDARALQPSSGIVKTKTGSGWTLEGTAKDGWNFACGPSVPVRQERIYAMRVRLRAWKSPVADSALFFKFGVHGKNWEWIANVNTPEYDFGKEGTWQNLEAQYRPASDNEARLMFCAEKGRTAPSSVRTEIASWTVEEIALP